MSALSENPEFFALLDFLKRNRGFDFTGYKTGSLLRRIDKRMQLIGIRSYAEYTDYLEVTPDEFAQLFTTILINVTRFFRDEAAWEFIASDAVPRLLNSKRPGDAVRVWSTGCASGEEAYSIAMLLAEALGEEKFRDMVKIYATDVDEEALNKARMAVYTEKEVEGVPPELLKKYFTRQGNGYIFDKDLRRNLIFGRNDIIQDAPISRIDLLICRNTLMYFNAETQGKILARFHFALNDNGLMFLGKAEMLLTHTHIFNPLNLKMRVFSKVPKVNMRDRMLIMAQTGSDEGVNQFFSLVRTRDLVFDTGPNAQIVIDLNNILLMANEQARLLFKLKPKDIGSPFQDLELSYRPAELRPIIQRAYTERNTITVKDTVFPSDSSEVRFFDIRIQPLIDDSNSLFGVGISFHETTTFKQLQEQLENSKHELETALEELQSTNEELETTNEELQSTIEELETTNEELHSTNEELETMNEELQSTNEELQTTNDELRVRTDDLNRVASFLESVITSVRTGMVVLDTDLEVIVWNHRAEDLWGLRSEEVVGRNFLGLDIGLPVNMLKGNFIHILEKDGGFSEALLDARDRRGKDILCKVSCSPLMTLDNKIGGVIALMEAVEPDGSHGQHQS